MDIQGDAPARSRLDRRANDIRLLYLEPSTFFERRFAAPGPIIRGSLRMVSLLSSPTYNALSYTWPSKDEKPGPKCHLDCGKYSIPISENCFDALERIWVKGERHPIWVDAICINQDDVAEKTHQVRLMGEIYSRARLVYVWLGQATPDSDQAFEFLSDIATEMRCLDGLPCVSSPRAFTSKYDDPERSTAAGKMPRRKYIVSVQSLLSRRWFVRGWTFQELVLADQPVFLCGSKALDWNTIIRGIARLSLDARDHPSEFLQHLPSFFDMMSLIHIWMSINRATSWNQKVIREQYKNGSSNQAYQLAFEDLQIWWAEMVPKFFLRSPDKSVSNSHLPYDFSHLTQQHFDYSTQGYPGLIHALRSRDVENPKDKSYALRGVLQALSLPVLSDLDYKKPLPEVYADLFRDLLEWTPKALDLILHAGLPRFDSAPSWIPRWDRLRDDGWLDIDFLLGDHRRLDNDREGDFENKHYKNRLPRFEGSELVLRGRRRAPFFHCRPVPNATHVHPLPSQPPTDTIFTEGLTAMEVVLEWLYAIAASTSDKGAKWSTDNLKRGLFYVLTLNKRYRSAVYHPKYRRKHRSRSTDWSSVSPKYELFESWFRIVNKTARIPMSHSKSSDDKYRIAEFSKLSAKQVLARVAANRKAQKFHTYLCKKLKGNRSLFVTKRGHFGTGSMLMQKTDHLYRLTGMAADVALREVDPAGPIDSVEKGLDEGAKVRLVGPALTCYDSKRPKNFRKSKNPKRNVVIV